MKIVSIIFLIILLIIISALLFCLFCKIRLVLKFSKQKKGKVSSSLHLEISGGIIKKDIPLDFKKKKKKEAPKQNSESGTEAEELTFIQNIKKFYKTFLRIKNTWSKSRKSVRKKILAEEISLSVSFGTDDASHTGIMTGALWGAIYNVIGFMAHFIRVTEPQITVTPDYDNEFLEFDGKCILRLSVANIISVFFILYINHYFEKRKQTKKEKAAINYVNPN